MDSDAMKALFLSVLERAKKKYRFTVENFCVMGNHFHLIVHPQPGVSLSSVMQWVMSVFAMAWNRLRGLTGHVWGSRFFSRVLESFQQYCHTYAYISDNPVKAGLVAQAEDWPFGGPWHRRMGIQTLLDEPDLGGF